MDRPKKLPFTSPSTKTPKPAETTTGAMHSAAPSTSQTNGNKVNAKKPKMGGLVQGHCGKEAWTGGKPELDWSGLENSNSIDFCP